MRRAFQFPSVVVRFSVALFAVVWCGAAARAQFPASVLIDSYETGVANTAAFYLDGGATPTNTVYLNHAQSSVLPTNGTSSMVLDMYGTTAVNAADPRGSATGYSVTRTVTAGDADLTVYNGFNAVGADSSKW